MDTRAKGKTGEDLAASYVSEHGGKVIQRNFYFKGGEIDLIAYDRWLGENYLCFIEVKARMNTDSGYPEEAVGLAKQKKIVKGAKSYLNYKGMSYNIPIRFDVISVLDGEVKWIKNAFTA